MFAIATLEHYCEAFPEKAETLSWYLRPRRRHTLLTELGRIARPRSNAAGVLTWEHDGVERLVEAALELAERRPTTKDGVARLRATRV